MGVRSILFAITLAACIDSSSIPCGGGVSCPEGTECAFVTNPDETLCVDPSQRDACLELGDNDACAATAGGMVTHRCYDGICLPAGCGNGRVDLQAGETCDDGNTLIGDGCAPDCRSTEICGDGVFDPLHTVGGELVLNERCDDGNQFPHDGCARCEIETPRWSQVRHGIPMARHGQGMAYDRKTGGVVMFGGLTKLPSASLDALADMWSWDGLGWTDLAPVFGPSARGYPAMAQDTQRDRIVLFGGTVGSNATLGDTWEWDGTSWQFRQVAANAKPVPRAYAGMAYDEDDARMILFGGLSPIGTSPLFVPAHAMPQFERNDTWEWDGQVWTETAVDTGPPVQSGHAMAYDPSRGVVVMVGSMPALIGFQTIVWEYDDGVWHDVTAGPAPLGRIRASLSWDPNLGKLVLHGGTDPSGVTSYNDTWAFGAGGWTSLDASGVPLRGGQRSATDPFRQRVVLFGGRDASQNELADTMEWDGDGWAVQDNPTPSAARHAAAYDARRGRLVAFGGSLLDRAVWELAGDSWIKFAGNSASPSDWSSHAMAYDVARDRTILFGGDNGSTETWSWNGTVWTAEPAGPPRVDHAMAYDPVRREIVLFGGRPPGIATQPVAETWVWNGVTWSRRMPTTSPPARGDHMLAFDETRNTVVLFGGRDRFDFIFDDTWEWNGVDWAKVSTAGAPPGRRDGGLAWNPARRRLVLFGGLLSDLPVVPFGDTWELDLAASPPTWTAITTPVAPPRRGNHVLAPSADGAGLVLVGGTPTRDDIWQLRWDGPLIYETCRDASDADGDGSVGCADANCWSVCDPLCPPTADPASCATSRPRCGDGICSAFLESCEMCPQDCACAVVCGDSVCAPPTETTASCPGDC